ncbi:TRAP transporter small permease [Deltaproteobacteria bacterium OttesenSCG-928-K17]|nr:TRAP transporter small permease [Deltaproteobacteria bacterium OttesenSCG-928-K17]
MKMLKYIDALINKFLKVGIIIITITVVTSMTLQICGRYFLPLPFYGLDEFTGHTAVWFYMLGAAYSASRSDHIKADMLEIFKVPLKAQHFISLLASAVSIVISGFMIVWSYRYVVWSISKHEVTPSLHIPTVYFQFSILLGAILLFLYFTKELINRIFHKQPFVDSEYESLVSNQ